MPKMDPQKNIIFTEKRITKLSIFLDQLKSPLVYILAIAAIISLLLNERADFLIIVFVITVNSLFGFFQESRAQNTLFLLKKLVKSKSKVEKNGKLKEVNSEDIMTGDIVFISEEFQCPADGKILTSENLLVNEASLTGESTLIAKNAGANVFAGTMIVRGTGRLQITRIGTKTKIGRIGKAVIKQQKTKTPLQKEIETLARSIAIIVFGIAIFIFFLGLYFGYGFQKMLTVSVAVGVAAVPEGLIIALTVILTTGMRRILKKKALVKKLLSAETLGSVSVICSDKTGTITTGELQIAETAFLNQEIGFLTAILANNQIDPVEITMLKWAEQAKPDQWLKIKEAPHYQRIASLFFNSHRKYSGALHQFKEKRIIFAFGAPEEILKKCSINSSDQQKITKQLQVRAQARKRILGFAYRYVDSNQKTLLESDIQSLTWNGFLAFEDPLRKNIANTIQESISLGVKIKMITGDAPETALAVAQKIKLLPSNLTMEQALEQKKLITGQALALMDPATVEKQIQNMTVFARTDPFQKLKIVQALQNQKEVVAMMGDGINDAPALKMADIGIVVNEATELSKDAADLILLDSNFKTIINAIEEGRLIFQNTQKTTLFLLSSCFSEILLITGALILGLPLPLTAAQILWINLIEDSFPSLALAFEPQEKTPNQKRKSYQSTKLLNQKIKIMITVFTLVTGSILLLVFQYLHYLKLDPALIQTLIFFIMGLDTLFFVFSCKSLSQSIFSIHLWNNRPLNGAVLLGLSLLLLAIYFPPLNQWLSTVPLKPIHLVPAILFGLLNVLTIEALKYFLFRYQNKKRLSAKRHT